MEELLTVREVAGYLHITRQTIYNMVNDGRLKSVRIGKLVRFRRSDVEELLEIE